MMPEVIKETMKATVIRVLSHLTSRSSKKMISNVPLLTHQGHQDQAVTANPQYKYTSLGTLRPSDSVSGQQPAR